jgi:hypothetical protein
MEECSSNRHILGVMGSKQAKGQGKFAIEIRRHNEARVWTKEVFGRSQFRCARHNREFGS